MMKNIYMKFVKMMCGVNIINARLAQLDNAAGYEPVSYGGSSPLLRAKAIRKVK